jgi:hypothetical protein
MSILLLKLSIIKINIKKKARAFERHTKCEQETSLDKFKAYEFENRGKKINNYSKKGSNLKVEIIILTSNLVLIFY